VLTLAFPTDRLEVGLAAQLALGNKVAFLLHCAQNASIGHLLAETPQQTFERFSFLSYYSHQPSFNSFII